MSVKTLWIRLKPYEGVIRFAIVLLVVNTFWKLTMRGDEVGRVLMFFGINLTPLFNSVTHYVAVSAFHIIDFFSDKVILYGNTIRFDNGNAVNVVWGCNGLKQMFIYFCLILFSRGPLIHKLWYIPLGLIIVNALNITRVTILGFIIEDHLSWFNFLHNYLLKYLFYGFMFLLWLLWEEVLLPKFNKEGRTSSKTKAQITKS